MEKIKAKDLGLIDYEHARDIQLELQNNIITGKESGHYFLFCEHPHVYTLGKSGKQSNLLINNDLIETINAKFVKTDRGGDITYHGPGQIVGYPIFNLNAFNIGVKKYVYNIEEAIIQTLFHFNINSGRINGATGVWLDPNIAGKERKICAIGIKVSRGVSMHGFAFNINTDLNYFNYINPCGFTDKKVTSLEKEIGQKVDMFYIKKLILKKISKLFSTDITLVE